MTGWLFVTGLGVTTTGWFYAAHQADVRRRRAAEREERRQRIIANLAKSAILTRPWTDEFGLEHCARCGGYLAYHRGVGGGRCGCPKRVAA